jgi:hypothetical protein
MKYRKLRIAWSVAWGIVCVLFIGLWVRSYKTADLFTLPITTNKLFGLTSDKGVFLASFYSWPPGPMVGSIWDRWHGTYKPGPRVNAKAWDYGALPSGSSGWYIQMPQMQFIFAAMFLAGASWLPVRRFSLRTLLIATTLVAVGLGLIVWLG